MQRPTIDKVQKAKDDAEKLFQDGLKFQGIKARNMPDFQKKEAAVKLNVAALKREKYLIDREDVEEQKKIDEMAMGLKDASDFNRWKREMDQKDDIERIGYSDGCVGCSAMRLGKPTQRHSGYC